MSKAEFVASEVMRFIKGNFSPEKQESIINVMHGACLIVLYRDEVSKEDLRQVLDKINEYY
jgi:hypothetical protein